MTAAPIESLQVVQLAPRGPSVSVADLLAWPEVSDAPFSATRRATLGRLSQRILGDPRLRADAASVALAYWLRRSSIDRLADGFNQRQQLEPDTVFVPAGRVFHVAPGNVDTVFVYSWALAYLCGNQNIVRVSGDQSEILSTTLHILAELMDGDAELAAGNRFVTYGHDQTISAELSAWATHRVVWGGDDTVSTFRGLPLSPHASERAFGSKFSYSVVSAEAMRDATAETMAKVAGGFFNDIFWFDQMACSSPHLIVWVGTPSVTDAAIDRFHGALAQEIERRGYRGAPSSAVHRLNYVFDKACDTELRVSLDDREFLGIRLGEGEAWRKEICGAGLFTHVRADRLESVASLASQRDQTVTHFGFSRDELRSLAGIAGPKGVDRFVPVGEALAFDAIWDGFDLIGDFVRRVTVRV
jgi:Acyl-CoA reductase (LuxC)